MIGRLLHGTRHLARDWAALFGCAEDELVDLVTSGILREEGSLLALKFVGVILRHDAAWVAVPGLMDQEDSNVSLRELDLLTRIVDQYLLACSKRKQQGETIGADLRVAPETAVSVREIDIFSALLQWTTAYGIHETESLARTTDPTARVSWSATFSECLPLVTEHGVTFHEPIAILGEGRLGRIGRMQARALTDLAVRYSPLSDILAFPYNDLLDLAADISRDSEGVDASWGDRLLEARHASNRDHEQELIAILQEYAKCADVRRAADAGFSFRGTVSFELVWEDICRVALTGRVASPSSMSNPAYQIGDRLLATVSQRPDIVFETDDGKLIVDAKYYVNFPETFPDLEDVRKQFFYSSSSLSSTAGLAFLFPIAGNMVRKLGKAFMRTPSKATDTRFGTIHCIGIPWKKACDAYLEDSLVSEFVVELRALATDRFCQLA